MSALSGVNLAVDPSLPIAAHTDEIAQLIRTHQVVILSGETGSGKTTQLPKICLSVGKKRIGHTQPRRIAARSVAARIAQEIGSPLGQIVGYQVRFTATTSAKTQLKVVTDGILLAEIANDRMLKRYDTIIIDEAHERSLNIDFLLGYLKQLLEKRRDLTVIITSATIDTARFSAHFSGAPIVEVSGRGYPVTVKYAPVREDDDPIAAIKHAVASLPRSGDILVFCSGEREIRDAAKAIEGLRRFEVLPLFARLTLEEQSRVFAPHTSQRVVLATNVAETSLTVPGIHFVVDPGFARISRYSARTKVQRLPIEEISQASANQRAGRCGRVAPGTCIRLYSEENFEARPAFTEPEILRTNLASVILAMANARLGDIADFPFVEPPDRSHITDGLRLLLELGAITSATKEPTLTALGRKLANLPIDPRLGRMMIEGAAQNCLKETLIIVAGLSIQDVRERPHEHREEADRLHARFASDTPHEPSAPAIRTDNRNPAQPARITPHTGWNSAHTNATPIGVTADPGGDFSAWLRLWSYVKKARKELSSSQFRKLCQREYLNYMRVREWQDLVTQLREVSRELKLRTNAEPAPIEDVLTACLSGLLSNIGALESTKETKTRRGPREYAGTRGARFSISPGSVLAKATPDLVMAVELVETTRLWAHTLAPITVEQIEKVGSHMLKRSYGEPFFSSSTGSVLAYEHLSLLGVPLAADRRVNFADVDPEQARAIFIQSGLVERLAVPTPRSAYDRVLEHNTAIQAEVETLEDKARRRGILVDDSQLFDFFDSRIPPEITSLPALEKWLKTEKNQDRLRMTFEDLLGRESGVTQESYPDSWTFGEITLGLDYRFTPGESRDGVTVSVPLATLGLLDPEPFTWGVPGNRLALAAELIRTLPKNQRTQFVPAPQWAQKALAWLDENQGDHTKAFHEELARALKALTGNEVTGWNPQALPDHLKLGFTIEGAPENQYSKDLESLQSNLHRQVKKKLTTASTRRLETGTTWVFSTIPESITINDHGMNVTAYPGLKDSKATVKETLCTRVSEAQASHLHGLARLVSFALPEPYKWVIAHMTQADKLAIGASPYPTVPAMLEDARLSAILSLITAHNPWEVRDQNAFDNLVRTVRPNQVDATHALVLTAAEALRTSVKVRQQLTRFDPHSETAKDVTAQIDDLIFDGFLAVIPPRWLTRVPIWLKGAEMRLISAAQDLKRDHTRMEQLDPVLDAYAELLETHPERTEEIDRIGYLIEELRLQTFAQSLKTIQTVSKKRIQKAIADIT